MRWEERTNQFGVTLRWSTAGGGGFNSDYFRARGPEMLGLRLGVNVGIATYTRGTNYVR